MAFFSTSGTRDPFLPEGSRDMLSKRGRELAGILLILLAFLIALAFGSYSPGDPAYFTTGEIGNAVPQNLLGVPGAVLTDLVRRGMGLALWSLPIFMAIWGVRIWRDRGLERAYPFIFTGIPALLVTMSFLASHALPAFWPHKFGLGGIVGDELFGAILAVIPVDLAGSESRIAFIIKGASLFLGASALALWVIAAGVTMEQTRRGMVVLGQGLALLVRLAWYGLRLAWYGLRRVIHRAFAFDLPDLPSLPKRAKPVQPAPAAVPDPAPEDGISARISAAVASRTARVAAAAKSEPVIAPEPEPEPEAPAPRTTPEPAAVSARVQSKKTVVPRKSARAKAEDQPGLFDHDGAGWETPPLGLLSDPSGMTRHHLPEEALKENARALERVLDDYGVKGDITSVRPGPVVTMYELEPAPGLKASRVIGLADDIARSMSALAARVSTVPGRNVIGIELPNNVREMVLLREIFTAASYGDSRQKLPLALGKDISGEPVVTNLAKMPHLLIAGTTGSGKSVAINTMILSLLYRLSPEQCRLIMIDPKMLELSVYDGIPHLLSPVVTDPKKAVVALKWVVAEMEQRYKKMSELGVRNIDGYNARVRESLEKGEEFSTVRKTGFDEETNEPIYETKYFTPEPMPFIVVVVDEMADLMMVAGKEIEACIQRLAQMARASGIHLIMATQRPSVDVITGTIKANFPTRISFQVTSKVDSRTILGEMGAEQLLGQGDMLYMAGGGRVTRVHGPFVSDEEVEEVVSHLKSLGSPEYVSGVVDGPDEEVAQNIDVTLGLGGNTTGEDALYDQAVAIVATDRKCSTSYIQRKLAIGYNKAARLVEQMEDEGIVSAANHVGKREVLVPEREQ